MFIFQDNVGLKRQEDEYNLILNIQYLGLGVDFPRLSNAVQRCWWISLFWSQPNVYKSFILPDTYARQDENNKKGRLNTRRNNILNLIKDQRD